MRSFVLPFILLFSINCISQTKTELPKDGLIPEFMTGQFEDDYGIRYVINDSLFTMEEHTILHIAEWNLEEQYFIGQNDSLNPYDPLLYTRIDWMPFEDMAPFEWGFCMSVYDAPSADSARAVSSPDRAAPRTGCGGYPFSRMKKINL